MRYRQEMLNKSNRFANNTLLSLALAQFRTEYSGIPLPH